jgi:hypothetical protein
MSTCPEVIELDVVYFGFQMSVWGAAAGGEILDFTAMLCEEPDAQIVQRWIDRTDEDLGCQTLNDGPVPHSWALPAVTQIRLEESRR